MMGWHRTRSRLRKHKKKGRKLNNLRHPSWIGETQPALPAPKNIIEAGKERLRQIQLAEKTEEQTQKEYEEWRNTKKSFWFNYPVEEYVLPNGDMVTDDLWCVAYYELDKDVPMVYIVDITLDGERYTSEFGEIIGVAFDKIEKSLAYKNTGKT